MVFAVDAGDIEEIADEDLVGIYESILEGAKNPAETFGFDEPAMVAIERMALAYFRSTKYGLAAPLYGFLLRMQPTRPSAWRGLGACAQAVKEFDLAVNSFERAVELAPADPVNKVFLGETLCQLGRKDEGKKVLQEVVDAGVIERDDLPYVARARAIVNADGGVPNQLVLKRQGKELVDLTLEAFDDGEDLGPLEYDETRDITFDDIKRNPELMKQLEGLKKDVAEGRLSLADIGGFTEDELGGAYAVACKYAEMDQTIQAMQIVGYLMVVDPYDARYYQLAGICLQRMSQYAGAEKFYGLAQAIDAEDPMTYIYRGESKIMMGDLDEGLDILKAGVEKAAVSPDFQALKDRGELLIKQFSTKA